MRGWRWKKKTIGAGAHPAYDEEKPRKKATNAAFVAFLVAHARCYLMGRTVVRRLIKCWGSVLAFLTLGCDSP